MRAEHTSTTCNGGPRRWGLIIAAAATVATAYLSGCDSGDGGDVAGHPTVQGYVESFTAGSAVFRPGPGRHRTPDLLEALADLLVPRAEAAVAGVTVHMTGTDLSTMTDADGYFVMSGAPAGHQRMEFTYQGTTSMMELDVPEDATVTMDNVRCAGSQATADHMGVEMHDGGSPTTRMMPGGTGMH